MNFWWDQFLPAIGGLVLFVLLMEAAVINLQRLVKFFAWLVTRRR